VILVVAAPALPFRVAHDVGRAELTALRIVHVGQSSVLLEKDRGLCPGSPADPSALVPVTWAGRGLAPGGFALADPDGPAVRDRLLALDPGRVLLDLSGWRAAGTGRTVDLRLCPRALDADATARVADLLGSDERPAYGDPTMDPRVHRALAPALASSLLRGDGDRVRTLVRRLVGAGPGATPTGDDLLVGALAALHVASGTARPAAPVAHARSTLVAAVAAELGRTTAASRHDLGAALNGSFAERAHLMTTAVTDVDAVEAAYRAALGWGATSGVDFLHGLARTAEALLGHRRTRVLAIA
jgi:hypothetical protein